LYLSINSIQAKSTLFETQNKIDALERLIVEAKQIAQSGGFAFVAYLLAMAALEMAEIKSNLPELPACSQDERS
jgi:hypothetical protein